MKKKKAKTREDCRKHFRKRWAQRFDTPCPPTKIVERAIRNRLTVLLDAQSHTRRLHKIRWNGVDYVVVYNSKINAITTVLPNPNKYTKHK